MSPTLNYTTKVPVSRTVGECQTMLAKAGAAAVATQYLDGRAVGLSFRLVTTHGARDFALPVNVDGVHRLLLGHEQRGDFRSSRQRAGTFSGLDHAERVAWRILKDWIEAQLAIIDAQMAQLDQVMLPYLVVGALPSGEQQTLYAAYRDRETLALEA